MKNKKNSAKIYLSRLHVLHMLLVPYYWSLNKKKNRLVMPEYRTQKLRFEIRNYKMQSW